MVPFINTIVIHARSATIDTKTIVYFRVHKIENKQVPSTYSMSVLHEFYNILDMFRKL